MARPQQHRFFLHFNKPATLKAGRVRWSVHFKNTCYIVDNITVHESVGLTTKTNKRQPRAVLEGYATDVTIVGKGKGGMRAIIYNSRLPS